MDFQERILAEQELQKAQVQLELTGTCDILEKARAGTYDNTAENRKLGRVGQKYGSKKEEQKDEAVQQASRGYNSKLASSGDYSQLASSGYSSQLASSGYSSQQIITGENSVSANIGIGGETKGVIGTWITLAEYNDKNECILVKADIIDGKKIKEDTWYSLKNGEFTEV